MRQPVLVPGVCGGLAIPYARSLRVRADKSGRVLLDRPDGDTLTLAAAGEITRVVQVGPGDLRGPRSRAGHGVVALMAGPEPRVVLDPATWLAHPEALAGTDLRFVTGIEPLAQALGGTVETATDEEALAVRRAMGRRGTRSVLLPSPPVRRQEDLLLVVALVAGFVSLPTSDSLLGLLLTLVGFALAAPVVRRLHRRRREFRRLVTTPPEPGVRSLVTSNLGPEWAGLADSRLLFGDDYLTFASRGKELWLPGPGLGGATRCVATVDDLVLLDSRDRLLGRIDHRAFDLAEVAAASKAAGVGYDETPLPTGAASYVHGDLKLARADSTMSEVEYGSTTVATPALTLCASLLLVADSLMCVRYTPLAAILVAGALGLVALCLHSWRLLKGWWVADRARPQPPLPERERPWS